MARGSPNIDFGRHTDDYGTHRPGFPDSFYDRLQRYLTIDGVTALDLGTGPGHVALALAKRGACVTGLDISADQIDTARRRAAELGLDEAATFAVAPAEYTGLPDASVDLVTAGQCWVWFDHDAALREVVRLLRPGGHFVVAHYCYLPGHSRIAARSEQLILEFNPGWTMAGWDGIYPRHIETMPRHGLELVEQFCYDHDQLFTHESWRGRMRTCNGVGSGGMTDEQVAAFDRALAGILETEFPDEPLHIEHRVWAVVTCKTERS